MDPPDSILWISKLSLGGAWLLFTKCENVVETSLRLDKQKGGMKAHWERIRNSNIFNGWGRAGGRDQWSSASSFAVEAKGGGEWRELCCYSLNDCDSPPNFPFFSCSSFMWGGGVRNIGKTGAFSVSWRPASPLPISGPSIIVKGFYLQENVDRIVACLCPSGAPEGKTGRESLPMLPM